MNSSPSPIARVRLHISYDGTDFQGWQRQTSTKATIQGRLEEALSRIFVSPIRVVGAGRTDAGVHAVEQVAHFDAPKDPTLYKITDAIQGLTPPSIICKGSWISPLDFHALHSATHKTYRYVILNRTYPSALRARYSWWQPRPLDLDYLNLLSSLLVGRHDFQSFQSSGTKVPHTTREISHFAWCHGAGDSIICEITGTGFLKQMVRNLIGTLVDLHFAKAPPERLLAILDAKDRRKALSTAPACGLHLYRVYYPQELDNKCRKL